MPVANRIALVLKSRRKFAPLSSVGGFAVSTGAILLLSAMFSASPRRMAFGQVRPATPVLPPTTVELASIRQMALLSCYMKPEISPSGRFSIPCATARYLIRWSNNIPDYQVADGPEWTKVAHYTIGAIFDSPRPMNVDVERAGVQAILKERFGLRTHWEMRPLGVLALVPAKGGVKVKRAAPDPESVYATNGHLLGSMAMADLAQTLGRNTGGIVVDHTSLDGSYTVELNWTPDLYRNRSADMLTPPPPPPPGMNLRVPPRPLKPIDPDGPPLAEALKSQLGLQLESRKENTPVLVIDEIHRPTEN